MKILFGILFIFLGGCVIYQEIHKRINCKEFTKGKIVDFNEKVKIKKGREKISRYPIFEYLANDMTIRGNFNERSKMHPYELGDEVDIYYNSNNVEEFYIKGNNDSILFSIIIIGVAVLLLFA